jgi:hypothetical protein
MDDANRVLDPTRDMRLRPQRRLQRRKSAVVKFIRVLFGPACCGPTATFHT